MHLLPLLLAQAVAISAQEVYITTTGTAERPWCTGKAAPKNASTPSIGHSAFSYTLTQTVRLATSVTPAATTPTYGLSYASASHLLGNVSTTTWPDYDSNSNITATDSADPYGASAYSALWKNAGITNITRGIYSTTVSPTPLPTSSLILPQPFNFIPEDGCYSFPKDFMLGVSGAAAQLEGAVAQEGRAPAVPDFFYEAGQLADPDGDLSPDFTAVENYFLYKQDIERLASMGVKYYSFSISWTRILPFTYPGSPVNAKGIAHYDDLINFVLEKGMIPVVTLIHFDTPSVFINNSFTGLLQETYLGRVNCGYQGAGFEPAMVNYGKIVMSHFADRVPIWITFNEPQWGAANGIAVDNILKSHAALYHFYHDSLNGTGQVSMKMGASPGVPLNPLNQSHIEAVQQYNDIELGSFLNPLALGIDYPDSYKKAIQDYVPLSADDLANLNGTLDFLAIDLYQASVNYPVVDDVDACFADNSSTNAYFPTCAGSTSVTAEGWAVGDIGDTTYGVYNTAQFVRTQLSYLWNTYFLPVVVTEFGLPMSPSPATTIPDLQYDIERTIYLQGYMSEFLKSIWEDGVDLRGAFIWSFVDNWEWGTFTHQYGMSYVNRTSQERYFRRSFFDAVDFVESRRLQ